MREIISKVQTQRKETGLEVTDRIVLGYEGNEEVSSIMKEERLSRFRGSCNRGNRRLSDNAKEWNINGEILKISVRKSVTYAPSII